MDAYNLNSIGNFPHHDENRTAFNEILITAMEQRPILWNLRHKEHKNIQVVAANWAEVADLLNTSVKIVSDRWRNLRDVYNRNVKILRESMRNGAATNEVKKIRWPHFGQMNFLQGPWAARQASGNTDGLAQDMLTCETNLFLANPALANSDNRSYIDEHTHVQVTSTSSGGLLKGQAIACKQASESASHSRKRASKSRATRNPSKRRWTPALGDGSDMAKETMEGMKTMHPNFGATINEGDIEDHDPDKHFLLSLLPHIRNTDPHLRQALRMNLLYIAGKYSSGVLPTGCLPPNF